MTLEQKNLYRLIDKILWGDWDPIGVNDMPEVRDEYQSYTSEIFSLKIRDADLETIAQHLLKIEEERMQLFGGIEKCRIVAAKIIAAKP